ncbi:hypothetical protein FQN60_018747 [Etheostoma spectabile]|uniref:Uncharacterized protein n=1 Tax=Etheostoma spectabile TaxID=54343 RepID=A0A5J5CER9_9PERO|nr:hypothetical protein FQN60_018747 [Etheostoma spectabile]
MPCSTATLQCPATSCYVLLCLVMPHSVLLCHELLQRTATNY